MTSYILRRLLGAIPLLLGIATLVFVVLNLAPGDPTAFYFNPNVPPEVIDQLRTNFGLDRPIHVRYLKWLGAFLTGDFGFSFAKGRPVLEILLETLPNTLILTGTALVLVFVVGVTVGVWQAIRQNSFADSALGATALFFYSMPSFWLALMMVLIFAQKAYQWGWPVAFPPTGMTAVDHEFLGKHRRLVGRARQVAAHRHVQRKRPHAALCKGNNAHPFGLGRRGNG